MMAAASSISPLVWLNGEVVPLAEARIGILDRGFLFGDGVYELVRFFDRVGVGMDLHVARLERSLREARISGFDAADLERIAVELLRANDLADACVYLQVTRGEGATRAHLPPPRLAPTVVAFASPSGSLETLRGPDTVRCVLVPDDRWRRCDIKSTSLLGNVLASMAAADEGADEPILHRDGVVSEGGSTNVFAWTDERLVTPLRDGPPSILHGISRALLLEAAQAGGIRVEEGRLTVESLRAATEIIITSSRRLLSSVVSLDGRGVGTGRPGPLAVRLFECVRPRLHSAQ